MMKGRNGHRLPQAFALQNPAPPTAIGKSRICMLFPVGTLLFLILLVASSKRQEPPVLVQDAATVTTKTTSMDSTETSTIVIDNHGGSLMSGKLQGLVEIPYYHCSSLLETNGETRGPKLPIVHVVLLHGAAFTKENWRESGILADFCRRSSTKTTATETIPFALQVTALDLSVRASADDLRQVLSQVHEQLGGTVQAEGGLNQRQDEQIQQPTGVYTVLVTPSASGAAVVEWIERQQSNRVTNKGRLSDFVHVWIPVASNSVLDANEQALQHFNAIPTSQQNNDSAIVHILAIYGNRDTRGRTSMTRLHQLVGKSSTTSTVDLVELPGGHPCYLDSPKQFVQTILDYLVGQSNTWGS